MNPQAVSKLALLPLAGSVFLAALEVILLGVAVIRIVPTANSSIMTIENAQRAVVTHGLLRAEPWQTSRFCVLIPIFF
jgi:hypothetical protein